MAYYEYRCEDCKIEFTVTKAIMYFDREEPCPECEVVCRKFFRPIALHGLSDGPGTAKPNKPHKPIFDLVDVHNDTQYAYNKMVEKGRIPALKIGNQWRFKKEDINRWVEKQRKN